MFDGVFTHYLIKELKCLENVRINKVNGISSNEFFLTLSSRNKLFISTLLFSVKYTFYRFT